MRNAKYFDNAATTFPTQSVLECYMHTATEYPGNPSANHREGFKAHAYLEKAREKIALLLSVPPSCLTFTSSASESIAICMGSLLWAKRPGRVITSAIEHEAVLSWQGILKEKGWEFVTLKAKNGFVSKEDLATALTPETKLVAIQMVNNVTGAIQDIKGLVKVVREYEKAENKRIFFFSDAVQALGKIPFSLTDLDIDGASFSAHKISGPRGIGALYLKKSIQSLASAGGQEKGIRGGTENLPAIAAFATALKEIHASDQRTMKIKKRLVELFQDAGIKILSPLESCSPYILSISTPLPSEVLTRMLIDQGYCVSSGSACSNNAKGKGEGVLLAMGYSPKEAKGAIRISLAHDSDEAEAENLAKTLITDVKEFTHG